MGYFYIGFEVAGGLGDRTILDRSVHPPVISKLHYHMEGWLGDAILESFPAFIVTEDAKQGLLDAGVTGAVFAGVEVTTSDEFRQLYPDRELPRFAWLKPLGEAGQDDLGAAPDGRLVISKRALKVLQKFGAEHVVLEPFDG